MSSRWKYRTGTVTVGDNSVDVRQLTMDERAQFAAASKRIKAGELQAMDLPPLVIKFGARGLAEDEIATMPPELADACVRKIMELSGLSDEVTDKEEPEKKDT